MTTDRNQDSFSIGAGLEALLELLGYAEITNACRVSVQRSHDGPLPRSRPASLPPSPDIDLARVQS